MSERQSDVQAALLGTQSTCNQRIYGGEVSDSDSSHSFPSSACQLLSSLSRFKDTHRITCCSNTSRPEVRHGRTGCRSINLPISGPGTEDARYPDGYSVHSVNAEPAADPVPLFGPFATDLPQQIEGGFRNTKHRAQWRSTSRLTVSPSGTSAWIRSRPTAYSPFRVHMIQKGRDGISRPGAHRARPQCGGGAWIPVNENPAAWQGRHLPLLLPKHQNREKLSSGMIVRRQSRLWRR